MKIYVSHGRDGDFQTNLYTPLKNSEVGKHHTLLLPHENSDKPFDVKDALERGEIDLVIAEVSYPSTGQGIELGWVNVYKVPIICIYKKGSDVSGSLKVLTDQFYDYNRIEDVLTKVQNELKF